jgi:hypothetical protein
VKIFLNLAQWCFVGATLYLASKFTENEMLGLVQFAVYITSPMALRYGTSGPNNSSPSSLV